MEVLGGNDSSQLNFRYSERKVVECIKKESAHNRREAALECSSDSLMRKYVEVTEVENFFNKPYNDIPLECRPFQKQSKNVFSIKQKDIHKIIKFLVIF